MESDDSPIEISQTLKVYTSFQSMDLKEQLLRGIICYGFQKPSAVQQRAIKPIIQSRDVIVQSQSGTGKTAVFTIAALQKVDLQVRQPQVLVLSPTRELSEQTQKVAKTLGSYTKVQVHSCIGGTSISQDIKILEKGVHMVSGTPGRVKEMILRRSLCTTHIKLLILDEADEMLDRSFKKMVYEIYKLIPGPLQCVIVSATLPQEILEMTTDFMTSPIKILVKRDELTLEGIRQYYVNVDRQDYKFATLCDIFQQIIITQTVIFCNRIEKVLWLAKRLTQNDFTVSHIHGQMPQRERDRIMTDFRNGVSRILVTTDLWGRGLDVQQVSLVVNYDLPTNRELYIHRIGRSGRFGRNGIGLNFVTDEEMKKLQNLEQFYSTQIPQLPVNLSDLM